MRLLHLSAGTDNIGQNTYQPEHIDDWITKYLRYTQKTSLDHFTDTPEEFARSPTISRAWCLYLKCKGKGLNSAAEIPA